MAQHGLQPHAPLRATSRLSYLHLPQKILKSHSFFSSLSLRARSLSSLLLFALFLLLSFSLPFSFSLPAPRMCGPSPRQGAQTFGSRQHKRRPTHGLPSCSFTNSVWCGRVILNKVKPGHRHPATARLCHNTTNTVPRTIKQSGKKTRPYFACDTTRHLVLHLSLLNFSHGSPSIAFN